MSTTTGRKALATLALAALLASCGGGGGSPGACVSGSALTCGGNTTSGGGSSSGGSVSYGTSDQAAGVCSAAGQRAFTRLYLNENYLWYNESPSVNEASFGSNIAAYFYALLTPLRDAMGLAKDRFSFIVSNTDADTISTGESVGYGVRLETDGAGRSRVAFVDAGSPAAAAGMARGGEVVNAPVGANWYPNASASITFGYRDTLGGPVRNITLAAARLQEDPLPLATTVTSPGGRRAGYLLFNAHTEGAQDKLIAAIQALRPAGLQDLVLDLRYNGGGYLYTALSLSTMVTGPAANGRVFEQLRFSDKRQADTDASRLDFSGTVLVGESTYGAGAALPRLGLPRVYVLATGDTCSASESVINSLRGVDVEVVIVGQTTCGKPYGFSRRDNCGLSYFPIEFQGTNAKGFGDYASGFAPTCAAADDFEHALGSTSERLLATALAHADSGTCPSLPLSASAATPAPDAGARAPSRGKLFTPGGAAR